VLAYLPSTPLSHQPQSFRALHSVSLGNPKEHGSALSFRPAGEIFLRSLVFARDDGPRPSLGDLCVFAGGKFFPVFLAPSTPMTKRATCSPERCSESPDDTLKYRWVGACAPPDGSAGSSSARRDGTRLFITLRGMRMSGMFGSWLLSRSPPLGLKLAQQDCGISLCS